MKGGALRGPAEPGISTSGSCPGEKGDMIEKTNFHDAVTLKNGSGSAIGGRRRPRQGSSNCITACREWKGRENAKQLAIQGEGGII